MIYALAGAALGNLLLAQDSSNSWTPAGWGVFFIGLGAFLSGVTANVILVMNNRRSKRVEGKVDAVAVTAKKTEILGNHQRGVLLRQMALTAAMLAKVEPTNENVAAALSAKADADAHDVQQAKADEVTPATIKDEKEAKESAAGL